MDLLNVVIRADTSGSDRAEASLDKMTVAAREADTAISGLGTSSATASAKMNAAAARAQAEAARLIGATKHNTAGIAAQFQDIGVTAAMGMNPLMIALQQGTQLTGQLATMDRPLETLGKSLLSLVSPLSLITIGLVALVAAGLQMVNWGKTAEVVLDTIANVLVPIAPYAAAAAIGLALLYSPTIIAGIGTAIGLIASMATTVWGLAAAIYATVGLPALLIVGFLALVAAAVIWRDDLTKVLGVDIVGAAQGGINAVIGFFVGGYNAIGAVWSNLGAVFQEIMWSVGQEIAKGFQNIVRNAASSINDLINLVPEQFRMGISPIDVGAIKFTSEGPNPNGGASASTGKLISDAMADAQGVDYVGKAVTFVQNAASGAADALRGFADMAGAAGDGSKKAAKEAERQAEAYRDIVRSAEQHIATSEREAQSLGMTEEATARLRYQQELLNKAANDNIKLTPAQTAELGALAASMAAAEEQTRRLTEIYDTGKAIFSSFFGDLKSGIEDGNSLWESLGQAASNALDSIANKALEMAANGIWDMIFGAVMSGITGGLGTAGNPFMPGINGPLLGIGQNANGTDNWRGGLSWVGEQGPELMNVPRGAQIIPNQKSMAMAANQNQANDNGGRRGDVHLHINGIGLNEAQLARAIADGLREYDGALAPKVEAKFRTMQNDPRAADGGW